MATYEERTADVRTTVVLGQWVNEMVADAAAAMNAHLELLGLTGAVVVNVEWTNDPREGYMCIGSKVPDHSTPLLAESLRHSADDVEDA